MCFIFNCKLASPKKQAAILQAGLLLHRHKIMPARYSKQTIRKFLFGTTYLGAVLVFNNSLNFYVFLITWKDVIVPYLKGLMPPVKLKIIIFF